MTNGANPSRVPTLINIDQSKHILSGNCIRKYRLQNIEHVVFDAIYKMAVPSYMDLINVRLVQTFFWYEWLKICIFANHASLFTIIHQTVRDVIVFSNFIYNRPLETAIKCSDVKANLCKSSSWLKHNWFSVLGQPASSRLQQESLYTLRSLSDHQRF